MVPDYEEDYVPDYKPEDFLNYAFLQGQDDYHSLGDNAESPFVHEADTAEWERGYKTEKHKAWFRRHGLE